MSKLGTNYGGWYIPQDAVNENSIVYSVGVGEDISFDILLSTKYKCRSMVLIDPTPRAKKHFEEVINYYKSGNKFTGNIQNDYYSVINGQDPLLDKFIYMDIGLWDKPDNLKFYKQGNPNYVSQTIIPGMFTDEFTVVQVDTIENIMKKNGHGHIDLLKLDIEGAEINVINNMLDCKIFPAYLCVEFDLKLKGKDPEMKTEKVINRLEKNGYKIIYIEQGNVTFKLDV